MSTLPGPSNAIVYAQFNMQGRWRRLLTIAIGYGIVLGVIIWLTYLSSGPDLTGWVAGLCVLQMLNLLVFGSFRVDSAVRGDVTSRMLESHRLMPATPLGGMLGYIFGSPLQAILLGGVNFIIGAICCDISRLSLQTWAVANGVIFLFAVFLYSMLAQFAFVARGGFLMLLLAGGMILGMSENREALAILPPLAVLINPLAPQTSIIEVLMRSAGTNYEFTGYLAAFAGQIAVIVIAVRVGMRRYESSTIAGISEWLGLLMLVVWVGLTEIFVARPDLFFSRRFTRGQIDLPMVLWFSLATSSLLALLPIGSAAWTARQAQRSGSLQGSRPRIMLSEILTMLAAIAVIAVLLTQVPKHTAIPRRTASILSMIIVANFLCSMACLFSWGYLIRQRAWIFVFIWVLITWIAPIATDAIYKSVLDDHSRDPTLIMVFSPPGALALIWADPRGDEKVSVAPGIIGQVAIAFVPTVILVLTQGRHRRRAAKKTALATPA